MRAAFFKSSKRERERVIQNPARERERELFKIQQEREAESLGDGGRESDGGVCECGVGGDV